jgi:ribonuclease BN (tRNA processing enzyme)
LTLTVVGSAGSSYDPVLRLPCPSYLLESAAATVLLDCGFGSFESLMVLRPEARLDAIILSHPHPDHVADFAAFVSSALQWRTVPRVIASRPTLELAPLEATTLGAGSVDVVGSGDLVVADGFEAEFSLTRHQIPTLAVQVTMGGARVVYSADTGPGWAFPASFRGADLAILECTFEERSDSSAPFHLDAREAAELVSDLSPHVTLITHVPPGEDGERRRDIARRYAPGVHVALAFPGLTMDVRRECSL